LIARRCFVAGRVQGVFYRASTRIRAETLGVTGHACNLPDGRVEVLACGMPEAVDALCAWLWTGSPGSSVAAVTSEDLPLESVQPWPQVFRTS
jgi:acylphosphatase